MLNRVKQVAAALTAKVTEQDRAFVETWLNRSQQKLFWAMALPDQAHALRTAYTALRLLKRRYCGTEPEKLVRCCLLHDVGKVRGDVSTFDKILAVLCYRFFPVRAAAWSRAGTGSVVQNFRHALYIYAHHAERSYDKLLAAGDVELARIVRRHHDAPAPDDTPELRLLREADELN